MRQVLSSNFVSTISSYISFAISYFSLFWPRETTLITRTTLPCFNVNTSLSVISADGFKTRKEFTLTAPLLIFFAERLLVLKNLAHHSHLSIRTFSILSANGLIILVKAH